MTYSIENDFRCPNCKRIVPGLIKAKYRELITCQCGLIMDLEGDYIIVKSKWWHPET